MRRPIRIGVVALLPLALAACSGDDAPTATSAPTVTTAAHGGAFPGSNNPTIDATTLHVLLAAGDAGDPAAGPAPDRAAFVDGFVEAGTAAGATVVVTEVGLEGDGPSADATEGVAAAIDAGADALVLVGVAGDDLEGGLTAAVGARLAVFAIDGSPTTGVSSVIQLADGLDPAVAAEGVLDLLIAYFSGTIPDATVTIDG